MSIDDGSRVLVVVVTVTVTAELLLPPLLC